MRARRLTIPVLASVLAMAACSGGDDTGDPISASVVSEAQPATTDGAGTTMASGGPVGTGPMTVDVTAQVDEAAASYLERAATSTTAPAATTTEPVAPSTTETAEVDGGGEAAAPGAVVMTVGDVTVEADIVQCVVAEPDVAFLAQGDNAQIEVSAMGGGTNAVVVYGEYEFQGQGTAVFGPAASGADQSDVTITGTGSEPENAGAVESFTIEAAIQSC